jgi:hypothetical protein
VPFETHPGWFDPCAQLNTETVDAIRNLEAALLLASEISNAMQENPSLFIQNDEQNG